MIRVRLAEPRYRDQIAAFLRLAGLVVTYPEDARTFWVDFTGFDLDEQAQARIVWRMVEAWQAKHDHETHADIETRG